MILVVLASMLLGAGADVAISLPVREGSDFACREDCLVVWP